MPRAAARDAAITLPGSAAMRQVPASTVIPAVSQPRNRPRPGRGRGRTVPPCAAVIEQTMDRLRPAPPPWPVRSVPSRVQRLLFSSAEAASAVKSRRIRSAGRRQTGQRWWSCAAASASFRRSPRSASAGRPACGHAGGRGGRARTAVAPGLLRSAHFYVAATVAQPGPSQCGPPVINVLDRRRAQAGSGRQGWGKACRCRGHSARPPERAVGRRRSWRRARR
jgi:hypothetical protein